MKWISVAGLLVLLSIAGGCGNTGTRAAWIKVLQPCAEADTFRGKVVYFGPSNSIGPGSVWRASETSGYALRRLLPDKTGDFVQQGGFATCTGTSDRRVNIKPSLLVEAGPAPLGGELAADLNRASTVKVSVASWAMDVLKEGDFETYVLEDLPPSDAFGRDVRQDGRLIMNKAVRVKGLTFDLTFNQNDAVALAAKYTDPTLALGAVGASLKVEWVDGRTLRLTTGDNWCYIAGTFAKWDGGLSGASAAGAGGLVPVEVNPNKATLMDANVQN